ncbi:MAG: NADH-quinone oxidoreductase subunit NuoN [Hyphomicrobiales bacterium]|nr:MAG: NADH-quinone oxidoreductase subunit NuoN [Hyphomicrobiales bacterium]
MTMAQTMVPSFWPALPELMLAVGAMALLLLGAFRREGKNMCVLSAALLVLAGIAILFQSGETTTFGGAFAVDPFIRLMKILAIVGSLSAMAMSLNYFRNENLTMFEYPILIVLATLGMLLMISANGLIALYLGLELQSLALYVLAAIRRDKLRSAEAGLKYFILGALSSGLLLYGASLIYGFTGTVQFEGIAAVAASGGPSLGLLFGLVFLLAGLAFKISAVPFHMWTPDVYEGAPTPVTAFFAAAPKIAAMALLIRVLFTAFPAISGQWQQILVFISLASMVLGAFAAIGQRNIKRLMAYSSIGHMGFALVGLAAMNQEGVSGVILYLIIYLVMTVGTFAFILSMRRDETMVENIDDLAGLSRTRPMQALALSLLMFSLAGIPPLAGFFAKFYVFLAAVKSGLFLLAVIGVLASVVGAFYYLRIVKVMYFDEPEGEAFEPMPRELGLLFSVAGLFVLVFFLYPAPVLKAAQNAAAVLF